MDSGDSIKYMLSDFSDQTDNQPLGSNCIIRHSGEVESKLLYEVDYYWYVSQSRGCVECTVKKSRGSSNEATTKDPNCVITKNHRRIEAYCCMICRATFVTVVQALLHLKTIHRSGKKIYIQNHDVFPPNCNLLEQQKANLLSNKTSLASIKAETLPPEISTSDSLQFQLTYSALKRQMEKETGGMTSPARDKAPTVSSVKSGLTNYQILACLAIMRGFVSKFADSHLIELLFNNDMSLVTAIYADGNEVTARYRDLQSASNHDDDDDESINDESKTGDFLLNFTLVTEDQTLDGGEEQLFLKSSNPKLAQKALSGFADKRVQMKDLEVVELACDEVPVEETRFMLGPSDSSGDEDKKKDFSQKTDVSLRDASIEKSSFQKAGICQVVDNLIATAAAGRIQPLPPLDDVIVDSTCGHDSATRVANNTESSNSPIQAWESNSGHPTTFSGPLARPYATRAFTYAEKIEMMKQQNDFDSELVAKHLGVTSSSSITTATNVKAKMASMTSPSIAKRRSQSPPNNNDDKKSNGRSFTESRSNSAEGVDCDGGDSPNSVASNGTLPSSIFSSEYYGSGEWATTAMANIAMGRNNPFAAISFPLIAGRLPTTSDSNLLLDTITSNAQAIAAQMTSSPHLDVSQIKVKTEKEDPAPAPTTVTNSRKKMSSVASQLRATSSPMSSQRLKRSRVARSNAGSDLASKIAKLNSEADEARRSRDSNQQNGAKTPVSMATSDLTKSSLLLASRLASSRSDLGRKSSSDPTLSSRISKSSVSTAETSRVADVTTAKNATKRNGSLRRAPNDEPNNSVANSNHVSSPVVANCGDQLIMLSDVTRASFSAGGDDDVIVLAQLSASDRTISPSVKNSASSGRFNDVNSKPAKNAIMTSPTKINMPVLFRNCVKTLVKVRFVERTRVCRVCGFSVTVDGDVTTDSDLVTSSKDEVDLDSVFMSHVMEHSLKEIVDSGGL